MLKIATITLVFLSACHFCAAWTLNGADLWNNAARMVGLEGESAEELEGQQQEEEPQRLFVQDREEVKPIDLNDEPKPAPSEPHELQTADKPREIPTAAAAAAAAAGPPREQQATETGTRRELPAAAAAGPPLELQATETGTRRELPAAAAAGPPRELPTPPAADKPNELPVAEAGTRRELVPAPAADKPSELPATPAAGTRRELQPAPAVGKPRELPATPAADKPRELPAAGETPVGSPAAVNPRERVPINPPPELTAADKPPESCLVTVDAAMTLTTDGFDDVHFFIGPQVQVVREGKFLKEIPRAKLHLDDRMNLQAAFVTVESEGKRIYYGDAYGKFVSVYDNVDKKRLRYGPARLFIRDGGPDAAARRAGKVYVFKGCKMALRNAWNDWETPVDVASVGLPCDIDAAWSEKGTNVMVVLKGDQIWHWDAYYNTTRGPSPFESAYKLKEGCALKPAREEKDEPLSSPAKPPQPLPPSNRILVPLKPRERPQPVQQDSQATLPVRAASDGGPRPERLAPDGGPRPERLAANERPPPERLAPDGSPLPELPASDEGPPPERLAPDGSPLQELPASDEGPPPERLAPDGSPLPELPASDEGPQPERLAPDGSPLPELPASDEGPEPELIAPDERPEPELLAQEPLPPPERPEAAPVVQEPQLQKPKRYHYYDLTLNRVIENLQ